MFSFFFGSSSTTSSAAAPPAPPAPSETVKPADSTAGTRRRREEEDPSAARAHTEAEDPEHATPRRRPRKMAPRAPKATYSSADYVNPTRLWEMFNDPDNANYNTIHAINGMIVLGDVASAYTMIQSIIQLMERGEKEEHFFNLLGQNTISFAPAIVARSHKWMALETAGILHVAVAYNAMPIVQLLIEGGYADVNLPTGNGMIPAEIAFQNRNADIFAYLVNHGGAFRNPREGTAERAWVNHILPGFAETYAFVGDTAPRAAAHVAGHLAERALRLGVAGLEGATLGAEAVVEVMGRAMGREAATRAFQARAARPQEEREPARDHPPPR